MDSATPQREVDFIEIGAVMTLIVWAFGAVGFAFDPSINRIVVAVVLVVLTVLSFAHASDHTYFLTAGLLVASYATYKGEGTIGLLSLWPLLFACFVGAASLGRLRQKPAPRERPRESFPQGP